MLKPIVLQIVGVFICFASYAQPIDSGLVTHFPFSGNANDASVSKIHGTVDGAQLTYDRFGNANSAYLFDGENDFIEADSGDRNITDKATVAAWVLLSKSNPLSIVVAKYDWELDKGYNLRLREDNNAALEGRDNNQVYISSGFTKASLLTAKPKWHFLVGTLNKTVWTIYVDGKKVSSYDTKHAQISLSNQRKLTIGAGSMPNGEGNKRYFAGTIDDVRLYNRVLSEKEIGELLKEPNPNVPASRLSVSKDESLFQVYPNPASEMLNMEFADDVKHSIATVNLVNAQGQVVFSSSEMVENISISHLVPGVYLVNAKTREGGLYAKRVVVR